MRLHHLGVAIALGLVTALAAPALAQTPSKPAAKPYTAPRTPWGHPDLQGIYTNKDESGIPMEKPDGLKVSSASSGEVDDSEFAEILRERAAATEARAPQAGGVTGAGPTHWYENYN